ncbi:MAG TPA: biopolymer transporter ExbD [Spirochaetota bacterium]|nr:biopolymer transporter ExbD [Spirochaetota bacterium]HOL56842.1 biopolymer transporter ExbD [Spirochaetota bacterium]HPP04403.1 biopolymer transporter ExbD [Spirochaetota bacterium]
MKIERHKRKIITIPISSMSDIAFLLLIFIMLISLINYKKVIKIDYPEANYKEVTQADSNLEIWIDMNGTVYYKGNIVDLKSLENIIVDTVVKKPDTRIHIIADKNTPYKNVDKVVEILKLLQHRVVSFVVKGD